MEEYVYYNNLFDIYEELLTAKERLTFKDYYQEDLSLAEIAESKNISRSAVQKTIKTVIEKLLDFENKLHIYQQKELIRNLLSYNDVNLIKEELEKML